MSSARKADLLLTTLTTVLWVVVLLSFFARPVFAAETLLWSPTLLERSAAREKEFVAFNQWLSQTTNLSFKVVIEPDYEQLLQRFETDELAMIWVGSQMLQRIFKERSDAQVLAMTRDDSGQVDYHCVLITREPSELPVLTILQSVALTQPLSTCGSIGAHTIAQQLGTSLEAVPHYYAGSHQNVVVSVMLGEVQSGIVAANVFERFSWLPIKKLLISHAMPSFVWLVNPHLVTVAQMKQLRLAFSQSDQAKEKLTWYVSFTHGFETDESILSEKLRPLMPAMP